MGLFERYLTLWVGLCIIAGIGLGHLFPNAFQTIGRIEMAHINLPVAVLVWLMIIPMLLKVDLKALKGVKKHWRGVAITLFVNWGIKPFSMALLGWLFIGFLFRPWLPADQIDSYIAGLIILAAAPCTAMVFAFAPIVALLLGLSAITIPWSTLLLSVLLYIVVPLIIANLWRNALLGGAQGESGLARTISRLHPFSLAALLATLVLLFGFQGEQIIAQPLIIALLAVPILIQVFFNSGLAYILNRQVRSPHCVAGPSALIGASNFFELAVATAIALFGFQSGAALATVVGVLIEVPVMLLAVRVVNRSRGWYESRDGVIPYEDCCPAEIQGKP
jgi:ACR3 family arsenite transporter